jgi:hypothetical protein
LRPREERTDPASLLKSSKNFLRSDFVVGFPCVFSLFAPPLELPMISPILVLVDGYP